MKLSKVVSYDLDFQGIWHQCSAALLGVFLFLRLVFYLGVRGLARCSGPLLWLELIIPVVIGAGYIALLRGMHLNRPLVYGILGALFCVLMMFNGFKTGSTFRCILGLVWYFLAAVVFLGTTAGYVSNRLILLAAFAIPVVFRFFADQFVSMVLQLKIVEMIPNLSILCALAGFACLAPALIGSRPEQ